MIYIFKLTKTESFIQMIQTVLFLAALLVLVLRPLHTEYENFVLSVQWP